MINNRKIHPKGNYVGTARDINIMLDKKTERRLSNPQANRMSPAESPIAVQPERR